MFGNSKKHIVHGPHATLHTGTLELLKMGTLPYFPLHCITNPTNNWYIFSLLAGPPQCVDQLYINGSRLSVCPSVCSSVSLSHANISENKRIPSMSGLTYYSRLQSLGLESLEIRRLRTDMLLAYRIMFGKVRLNSNEFFSR